MTPQMRDTLDYLRSYTAANRVAPSHQEIADHLGLRSKSSVHERLARLEARGLVRRIPHQARSLEIVEKTCPHCGREL